LTPILFVCSELQRGGAERQWAHLVPALRDRGFEPRVLALRDTGPFFDELAAAGIPVVSARMRSRFDVAGLRRAFAAAGRPALVVSQGTNALVVGEAIARRHRSPHVTIEHGAATLPRTAHRRFLTRVLGRSVDRVVAVSGSQLERLQRLGYDPARISLVPNGVPVQEPTRSREETRRALAIEDEEVAVVLVATLRTEKNVPLFLDAVERARMQEPRVRGFIAGGGPELERIRELAAGGTVSVLGERDDVPDLLEAADVVCLTSDTEALPMVLLEAMALGRPIVATDVGGIRELVVDGVTGILVPAGDADLAAVALLRLAGDADERRALGAHGRARHEELFSLERMVDDYHSLLESELRAKR
jgi:glycosyltransferase involved in cell wall biosynthesis